MFFRNSTVAANEHTVFADSVKQFHLRNEHNIALRASSPTQLNGIPQSVALLRRLTNTHDHDITFHCYITHVNRCKMFTQEKYFL